MTLPQAAAAISVLQGPLGLTLAAGDTGSTGETGAPVWEAPFVSLPLWDTPVWAHGIALLALPVMALGLAWFVWRLRSWLDLAAVAIAATCAVAAVSVVVVGPVQGMMSEPGAAGMYLDCAIAAALLVMGTAMAFVAPAALGGWRRMAALLGPAAILTWLWLAAFGGGLTVAAELLPSAAPVSDLAEGKIAVNYMVPVLTLLLLLAVGGAVGIAWGGGVWILSAGAVLRDLGNAVHDVFHELAGSFHRGWQSLGYWLAQQEVARGNQPWYYYGVGLTVYELLALVFGLAAVVWLIRRREPFGIVLAGWVIATLAIYTIAAEKMPWLMVNITVPLALATGMLLGRLMDGIRWPQTIGDRWRLGILLGLAPVWVVMAVWVAWLAARGEAANLPGWLAALILLPTAAGMAWLVRTQQASGKAVALGIAGLLLVFGTVGAFRAAYTYDDSRLEILAYAQGSADLLESYARISDGALNGQDAVAVKVDYDMWYPFQWYVRNDTEEGTLWFDHFCTANVDKGSDECRKVGEDTGPVAYLAEVAHAVKAEDAEAYNREGPMRNLLWYPETYRRPGEARDETAMWSQLVADVDFFKDSAVDPEKWQQAIEYIVARRQERDWYSAEYYQYVRDQELQ